MAGRPTAYRAEYAARAAELCANGATDADLAREFGVSTVTIYAWRNKHPEFLNALKVSKPSADDRVERSLFQRAVGYTFESEKIFCSKDGKVTRVKTIEHVPPDTTAQIFWLKNRRRDKWRDKQEHEVSGPDGGAIKTEVDLASGLAFTLKKGLRVS